MSSTAEAEQSKGPTLINGETYVQRAWRMSKENPTMPIGALVTVGALSMSILRFQQRNSQSLQFWMRARVAAQFLTIAASIWGIYGLQHTGMFGKGKDEFAQKTQATVEHERFEFEQRLKQAEAEVEHWAELRKKPAQESPTATATSNPSTAKPSSGSWWEALGWTKKATTEEEKPAGKDIVK